MGRTHITIALVIGGGVVVNGHRRIRHDNDSSTAPSSKPTPARRLVSIPPSVLILATYPVVLPDENQKFALQLFETMLLFNSATSAANVEEFVRLINFMPY